MEPTYYYKLINVCLVVYLPEEKASSVVTAISTTITSASSAPSPSPTPSPPFPSSSPETQERESKPITTSSQFTFISSSTLREILPTPMKLSISTPNEMQRTRSLQSSAIENKLGTSTITISSLPSSSVRNSLRNERLLLN